MTKDGSIAVRLNSMKLNAQSTSTAHGLCGLLPRPVNGVPEMTMERSHLHISPLAYFMLQPIGGIKSNLETEFDPYWSKIDKTSTVLIVVNYKDQNKNKLRDP